MSSHALTPRQQRFVDEYLIDLNASAAARRAGYSQRTAEDIGRQLLRKAPVLDAITAGQRRLAVKTEITQEKVLERLWQIATANPADLVTHRTGACRFCYGTDHEFQWKTEREYLAAVRLAEKHEQPTPTDLGGYGYDITLAPRAACPECNGLGEPYIAAADTDHLNGPASLLYQGSKQTREGIEIKLADQMKALEMVARHLGLFNDKLTLKGDQQNPLTLLLGQIGKSALPVVATPPSDDEEDAVLAVA